MKARQFVNGWQRMKKKATKVALAALLGALALGVFAARAGYPMWIHSRAVASERHIERDTDGVREGMQSFAVGEGDTELILIHGFASGPAVFRPMADALAGEGIACRAIRLPGFGEPMDRMFSISEADWRNAVESAVADAKRKNKRIWLVGHSMGAALAVDYALAHREDVAGLVLIAPLIEVSSRRSLGLPPEMLQRVADCVLPRDAILETAFPIDLHTQADGVLELRDRYLPISMYDAMFRVAADIRERGGELELPVLMIVPGADKVVSRRASVVYFDSIASPRKELFAAEEAGHVVPLDYGWEKVAQRVNDFVGSLSADIQEESRL